MRDGFRECCCWHRNDQCSAWLCLVAVRRTNCFHSWSWRIWWSATISLSRSSNQRVGQRCSNGAEGGEKPFLGWKADGHCFLNFIFWLQKNTTVSLPGKERKRFDRSMNGRKVLFQKNNTLHYNLNRVSQWRNCTNWDRSGSSSTLFPRFGSSRLRPAPKPIYLARWEETFVQWDCHRRRNYYFPDFDKVYFFDEMYNMKTRRTSRIAFDGDHQENQNWIKTKNICCLAPIFAKLLEQRSHIRTHCVCILKGEQIDNNAHGVREGIQFFLYFEIL